MSSQVNYCSVIASLRRRVALKRTLIGQLKVAQLELGLLPSDSEEYFAAYQELEKALNSWSDLIKRDRLSTGQTF